MVQALRVAILLSVTFLYGCELALLGAGAGLGAGTYRYIEGSVEMNYTLPYTTAWEATNRALAVNNISVANTVNEGGRGRIEAIRKDGEKVLIKVSYTMNDVTSINVRVGFFGNREDAEKIHNEIRAAAGLTQTP